MGLSEREKTLLRLHLDDTSKHVPASGFSFANLDDVQVIRKSADETVNNSDVLQDDDELKITVGANEIWYWQGIILIDMIDNSDFKITFTVPALANGFWEFANQFMIDKDFAVGTAYTGATGQYSMHVCGYVINGANAGNVTLQWCQNTAVAENTKVLANSFIIAHRLYAP